MPDEDRWCVAPTKHGGTCLQGVTLPDMCKPYLLQIVWVAAGATITASLATGLCWGRNDGVVQACPVPRFLLVVFIKL